MQDSLGDRQKQYEDSFRITLPNRMPVLIRLDGKSFSSLTKPLSKPINIPFVNLMNDVASYLCENIQGCQLSYLQSDEISLLLNNYKEYDTQPWLGNNLQKITSVPAAWASSIFTSLSTQVFGKMKVIAFDARAWLLPKEDVNNYFLWRQRDCTRNSISMLAQSLYSHKELIGKNSSDKQELCFQKGINWNNLPTFQKRGRCIVKQKTFKTGINKKTGESVSSERMEWKIDNEIPIFSQDKNYIEQFV